MDIERDWMTRDGARQWSSKPLWPAALAPVPGGLRQKFRIAVLCVPTHAPFFMHRYRTRGSTLNGVVIGPLAVALLVASWTLFEPDRQAQFSDASRRQPELNAASTE